MGAVSNLADTAEFRVALIESSSGMLLAKHEANGFHLPRVRIPKWTRPAEEINEAVRKEWHLNSLVLKLLPTTDNRPTCAVAEVIASLNADARCDLSLKGVAALVDQELDAEESASIYSIIANKSVSTRPFSRCGWLREAQEWIHRSVPDQAVEFSEDFRQYNANDSFVLVRLGIKGGRSYWLKATGEPNTHECGLTVKLAKLFPDYLPIIVAVREDWNAWVTEDAGSALGTIEHLEVLTAAVSALADLQILSLPHISSLEQAGCMDRTLGRILVHLPENDRTS